MKSADWFHLEEWKNLGRWIQPPLSGVFWSHWHEAESLAQILPQPFSTLLFVHGYTAVKRADEERVSTYVKELSQQMIWDRQLAAFERVAAVYEKRYEDLLSSSMSLEEYATKLFEGYGEIIGIWTAAILIGAALEEYLLATTGVSREVLMEKMIHLRRRKTWLEQESEDLRGIAAKKRAGVDQQKIDELIEEHVRQYIWFGTHHWEGEPYTFEKAHAAVEELSAVTSSTLQEQGSLPHDPIWKWIEAMVYWRTHSAELTAKIIFASRPRLEEVAARLGVTYDELVYASAAEILAGLRDPSRLPNQQERAARRQGYVSWVDGHHQEHIISGVEETARWIELLGEARHEDVSSLRGTVAYAGPVVEGVARVVLVPKHDEGFQEGDILIAAETTPDYVPLMKRAAAFVTEVGGITSHAAIVAREMKKPCLIAVKSATHVLKTGERISLDTQRGTITRL